MRNKAPHSTPEPEVSDLQPGVPEHVPPAPIARSEGVLARAHDLCVSLALGSQPRLRLRLKRILIAMAVYVLAMVVQWHSVESGMADRVAAQSLAGFIGVGVLAFYAVIRSGFTLRFADPAWTWPQMIFAIVSISLAYQVNPHVRGVLTLLVALVIMFGVFTLSPKSCRALGWIAIAALGTTMAYGVWRKPDVFTPLIESHHFVIVATSLIALSYLAGELSQMRISWKRQRRELQAAMERVQLDALTGLPNRLLLADRMAHALALAKRQSHWTAVCFIDLDEFKLINDKYGHAAGDQLLVEIGRRLLGTLRTNDTAARLAGDEFVLLLTHMSSEDEYKAVLHRVMTEISRPLTMEGGRTAQISASVGVALSPNHGEQPEELLKHADAAMYEAKRLGRNQIFLRRLE